MTAADQAPDSNRTQSTDSPQSDQRGAFGSSSVQVNLGGVTLFVVVVLVTIIAACGLVMGLNLAKQAEMDRDFRDLKTQEWLKERRLMDAEAYMIANGIKIPGDDQNGPTGNIHRMKPKEK